MYYFTLVWDSYFKIVAAHDWDELYQFIDTKNCKRMHKGVQKVKGNKPFVKQTIFNGHASI